MQASNIIYTSVYYILCMLTHVIMDITYIATDISTYLHADKATSRHHAHTHHPIHIPYIHTYTCMFRERNNILHHFIDKVRRKIRKPTARNRQFGQMILSVLGGRLTPTGCKYE